jgi:hypothetical protein
VPLLAGLEGDLLLLDLARERFRLLHLAQDLVLDAADLALHPFDLVEHGGVLLVRLDLHELALVLGALPLEVLQRSLVALAGLERIVEGMAGGVEMGAIRGQLRLQLGLSPGDLGHPPCVRLSSLSTRWRWISCSRRGSWRKEILTSGGECGASGRRCPLG